MKKLLLFVIACTLGLFGTVNAQETITIGEGGTTNAALPVDFYNGYGICQQIFLADEINHADGGVITSMAIKFFGETMSGQAENPTDATFERNVDIYINSTELTELTGGVDLSVGQMPDFQGTVTYVPEEWTEIVFDTPYQYDGGNIIITMHDYTGGNYQNYYHFYADDAEKRAVYANITSKLTNEYLENSLSQVLWNSPSRNNIQLTFAAAGEGGGEEEGGDDLASSFSFDFEDGTLTGLRVFAGEGSNAPLWAVTNDSYYSNGTNVIYSASYDDNTWMTYASINNYIVTENAYAITAESKLSWYVRHTNYNAAYADVYEVVVSEDGETFTQIWSGTAQTGEYAKEISLAEYAGKNLYIGFRHYCVDEYGGDAIVLDDIVLSAGEGGGEEPTPEPEPTIPAAPASMTATANGQNSITLTWEAVEGATSYNIYSTAAGNVPAVTATEYTYEGLTAGTQYCFEVTAENAVGESYDAAYACATTTEAEIEEPTVDLTKQYRVKATSLDKYLYVMDNDAHATGPQGGVVVYQTIDDDAQLFTLEDAGDGAYYFKSATGYYIYCQAWNVDAYSTTAKTALKMVDQGDGTFRLQNTNNDKYFKVEQVGALYFPFCDCDGTNCTIETWTLEAVEGGNEEPEPTPVAPAAPTNVVATADGQNSIIVTWNAVEGATYYIVYKDGQMWDQVNGTTYTSTGLTAGTEYCYAVQAYDANGLESELSEEVCETTEAAIEIPEGATWNCSVEFVLGDTYGDGWNYNNLYVSYGDVTEKLTLTGGKSTTYVLEIPKGTHVTVTYKPEGSYQYENTFGVRYYGDTEYIYTQYTINNNQTYTHEFDVNCEPSMPSVPALTATATGGSTIVLTIEGAGAESYNIYEGGELFAEGVTGNTYTVEGLEPETEYCFTATAVNFLGETEPSEAACATTLKAGTAIVQVGTGTTNTYQAPICDYYSSYSVSQMIYTEEEIGYGSGKVTSISFYQNEGTGPTRSLSVYMKNVSKDIFGNGTAEWEALEADMCVYQGSFTFGTSGWVEIALQNEFVYEAGNNLMVCVIDNTGSFPAGNIFEGFAADVVTGIKTIFGTGNATDPLNITTNSYPLLLGTDNLRPIAKFVLEPAPADVKVKPETIAFGDAQLGEYWSENGAATIAVTVKPIITTITSITCDNEFFVLPAEIDYTANPIEFAVAYDHNAAAGEYTGNLTITYGDGATKVVPMTATAYAPVTPDVFELAQEITFTENAYTDTPVFADLKDDYNLPKEANAGNTPDAVYSFGLAKESFVSVEVTGTNAVYALYQEDFSGEEGPMANNKVKGNGALSSFAYDFNDGNLDDFYMIEKDAVTENYKNHEQNWKVVKDGPDASNCLISFSFSSNPSIHDANNYIVTKDKYVISADSKLTFDAKNYSSGDPDYLKIEVSEDGENFTYLVTATPGMGEWATVEVELGTLLASAGLEYGEYHIALHHEEVYHMYIMVDNLALTSSNVSKISYPAGKYYLVAAAEDEFTVNVNIEKVPAEPEAPVVAATATESTVTLTWEAVEDATSYNIYSADTLVASVTELTYIVEGLTAETTYSFTVTAVNEIGESEASNVVTVTTEAAPVAPAAPVVTYAATHEAITLTWEAVEDALSYNIYSADTLVANVTELTYTVTGLTAETEYTFSVTAVGDLESEPATVTVTTEAAPVAPAAPVVTYAATHETITLTWEAVADALSYNIYSADTLVANVTELTYTVTGLTAETEYTFSVTAVGDLESEPATVTVTTLVPAPVAKDYRLDSVAGFGVTKYIYDEELTNKVVAVDEDGLVTVVSYTEDGQIASAIASYEDVDEEGNPVEVVVSGAEYEYDENGVWVGYTETSQSWFGGVYSVKTELGYNEEGQLVSLTSEEGLVRELSYNEDGLLSQVLEGYVSLGGEEDGEENGEENGDENGIAPLSEETTVEYESKVTFEYDVDGRLVKKEYYYFDAYETMEFYLAESEVYEYDENGNCLAKKAYETDVDEEANIVLKSFPYSVTEYIYDLTISNEDVYSFEYPHFAFMNWVEPSYVNILTKELSHYSYYDEELEEIVDHSYDATIYFYTPEVLSAPLAPMNLTAEVLSASEVELAWAGFADAETFTIYSADTVYAEGLVDPYYTVEGLEIGVNYCFEVVAVNTVGTSEASNTACVTIELPAAPANLVAEATSETTIALTWEEVEGIYEYNVYKVVEVEGEKTYELLGTAWWINYTVEDLEAATEYSFVVKAVSVVGESEASNVATVTTLAPPAPTVPAAPVVEGSFEGDIVHLVWEPVEGALYYNLYYSGKLLSEKFEETTVDIQVPEVGTYCFTVTAVNEIGESEHSDEVCVTVTAPEDMVAPEAPVLEATLDEDYVVLTWEAVEGATYYEVYIASSGQGQYLGTATMEDLPIRMRLPEHGIYCFYVIAYNLVGESEPSNTACVNYGGVGVEENEFAFEIYPNPASDRVVIETEANIESVAIYTLTGVMVYSEVDLNNNTINVSDFASGVYIMKVRTDNGEVVKRFIKK